MWSAGVGLAVRGVAVTARRARLRKRLRKSVKNPRRTDCKLPSWASRLRTELGLAAEAGPRLDLKLDLSRTRSRLGGPSRVLAARGRMVFQEHDDLARRANIMGRRESRTEGFARDIAPFDDLKFKRYAARWTQRASTAQAQTASARPLPYLARRVHIWGSKARSTMSKVVSRIAGFMGSDSESLWSLHSPWARVIQHSRTPSGASQQELTSSLEQRSPPATFNLSPQAFDPHATRRKSYGWCATTALGSSDSQEGSYICN
ncbi:hypothetical protein BV25DRAFT_1835021 [Artomyces pyxidatus]|uniref:Uncharacterized protein n=1 Tax=Artomyces pyxidatus TaxID=48021 RepID=A0ACB8TFT8_9AGAM|nr:hypothetical protein BV25DRAFT_1835021 [Artomyces pyxidatus]